MGVGVRDVLKPLSRVVDCDALREEYERKPLAQVVAELEENSRDGFSLEVKRVDDRWLYFIAGKSGGFFWPSYLTAYFYCAKQLWLQHLLKATVVGERGLRCLARGVKAHKIYARYLEGRGLPVEKEVHVHGVFNGVEVDGYIDLLAEGVPVEVKSGYKEHLGHRLQAMLYAVLVGSRTAYIVYPHRVVHVAVDEGLLGVYVQRVLKVIGLREPPPEPPAKRNSRGERVKPCDTCEVRVLCAKYPSKFKTWDSFLAHIGELPRGDRCLNCPHLEYCRAFKARHEARPCMSHQRLLKV
ncbi:MAG: hypothetical protein DRJ68_07040 [Thermoprotei archaeon]|nr:MAG: hypothetical protein DRJ68_07040 [Thermoprotei archaeon]